jgi:hypothetical protein
MKNVFTFAIVTTVGLAFALPTDSAVAQEKWRVSFKVPVENSKFAQRHTLDVGDVPGHQLLLFELHRTHPSNRP